MERALRADCGMLMASSTSFGSIITLLIQVLTLVVLLLLSIVLSLLAEDSTAVSYILLVTLLLTLLVHELGVTRWNSAYAGTFRLVILWNLWISAAVLFKLYSQLDVFGRVMGVLVSVFSTSVAVISLCLPQLAHIFAFLSALMLLFPLADVGLFGDSTLLLSVRLSLYIVLCIVLDRLCSSWTTSSLLLPVCCFWVLLVLPHFWVASLLLLLIAWYKSRRRSPSPPPQLDDDDVMEVESSTNTPHPLASEVSVDSSLSPSSSLDELSIDFSDFFQQSKTR